MSSRSRVALILIYAVHCLSASGIIALGPSPLVPTAARYALAVVVVAAGCGIVAQLRALRTDPVTALPR